MSEEKKIADAKQALLHDIYYWLVRNKSLYTRLRVMDLTLIWPAYRRSRNRDE